MPLTDTKARTAKPTDKVYKLQDGNGLYLEVRPTGSKKWRCRYWKQDGKDGIYTIGNYPAVTLAEARTKREWVREQVVKGFNPTDVSKAVKTEKVREAKNTFEILAKEWLQQKARRNSEKTIANQAQISGVKDSVQASSYAALLAIRDDGDRTRALISSNESATLDRQLGVLETTLLIERNKHGQTLDTHALTIQNINTNTAVAMQQQQQSAFNDRVLSALHCCDQNIRATNQAINIGSGAQVATPKNTSTNNRVN